MIISLIPGIILLPVPEDHYGYLKKSDEIVASELRYAFYRIRKIAFVFSKSFALVIGSQCLQAVWCQFGSLVRFNNFTRFAHITLRTAYRREHRLPRKALLPEVLFAGY